MSFELQQKKQRISSIIEAKSLLLNGDEEGAFGVLNKAAENGDVIYIRSIKKQLQDARKHEGYRKFQHLRQYLPLTHVHCIYFILFQFKSPAIRMSGSYPDIMTSGQPLRFSRHFQKVHCPFWSCIVLSRVFR